MPAVRWLAAQLVLFHRGPLVQVLLTYPGGRAIGLAERGGVGLGYVAALAPQLWTDPASSVVLAVLFAGIAVHGAAISRAIARRVRIVAAGVAVILAALVAAWAVARLTLPVAPIGPISFSSARSRSVRPRWSSHSASNGCEAASSSTPWSSRREASAASCAIRAARLLDDPGLELGFWSADQGAYLVADGMGLVLPDSVPGGW